MQYNDNPSGQKIGTTEAYVENNYVPVDVYSSPYQAQAPVQINFNGTELDFSALNTPTYVNPSGISPSSAIITGKGTEVAPKKRGRKKKKKDDEESNDAKNTVENTVYADTYYETNNMTYGIINQTDELINECKAELDYIRAQKHLKGRYHYINDAISSMGTLLGTKLSAIKEINSTIKAVNDNEYRRFKDMRALANVDDNKAVMDAYSAFISAPVGAPAYNLPGTANLTGCLNGIIQANYPEQIQENMNTGLNNYLNNLSPEENLMLNDNNKDIEEVIVYDQASGAKYFQWMNTRTNEIIPNMPVSSELTIEDFTIDPRTRLAKNHNLNCIKKVIVLNEGAFDRF